MLEVLILALNDLNILLSRTCPVRVMSRKCFKGIAIIFHLILDIVLLRGSLFWREKLLFTMRCAINYKWLPLPTLAFINWIRPFLNIIVIEDLNIISFDGHSLVWFLSLTAGVKYLLPILSLIGYSLWIAFSNVLRIF